MKMRFPILLFVSLILVFTSICADAANYYVSKSGDDGNPGTEALPWKTIQHAADSANAGDTVYVRRGVYSEQVNISKSGSATGGSITFQNYAGETPIIDGTGITPGSSHSPLLKIENQGYVIVKGFEIRNLTANTSDSVPVGIFITGYGSHIQILDNTVHHIVQNEESTGNAHGIAVYATDGTKSVNNLTISGNTVRDCKLGWSESMVLNGNVEMFTVSNNNIHDNDNIGLDLIGYEGTAPANDQARNGTVTQNTIYNITSFNNPAYKGERSAGGIYVDGGRDIVIERNYVSACDIGIEVGCEHKNKTVENVIVRNNLLVMNNVTGLGFGGYANDRGVILNCRFEHNTFFKNDTTYSGTGEIMIQKSHDNQITNNIIFSSDQNIIMTNYFTGSYSYNNTFDYNLYFATEGSDACVYVWQNKSYTGFGAFQNGSGQDAHSVFDNPDFVNESSSPSNLHLTAGSPAIGAGDPAFTPAVGEFDFDGNARVIGGRNDCGAYEYNGGGTATLRMAILPVAGGTTNPTAGAHIVPTGVAQSITATAAPGYKFINWSATANATIADASSSSTNATLTGDATATAHFSVQTGGVKLTVGSVYQVEAADVDLVDFEWKPRVVGVKKDNWYKANVLTKISKDNHPTSINVGWTKKRCIYDKNVYDKRVVLSRLLASNRIPDLQFDRMVVEYDGVEHDLAAIYYLANPNIGAVTGSYSEPDDVFVVTGNYFGSNLPSLYVEYLKNGDENSPGYRKCMLDKSASLKYQNASRNAGKSCMLVYADDPAAGGQSVGHSEITAIYPSLKATDVPTGYVILDNGVGLDAYYLQGHAGL